MPNTGQAPEKKKHFLQQQSLDTSILTLVIVPILIQVALAFGFLIMQHDTEQQLQRVNRSREIMIELNELQISIYSVLATYQAIKFNEVRLAVIYRDVTSYSSRIESEFVALKQLAPEDQEIAEILREVVDLKRHTKGLLRLYASSMGGGDQLEGRRKLIEKDLNDSIAQAVKSLLPRIPSKLEQLMKDNSDSQNKLREKQTWMMTTGVVTDLLLTLGVALVILRRVRSRIHKLSDNAMRFSSGATLNPVESGTDELANLDQVFHNMAQEVRESARKESLLLENVADLIISLSERMQVIRSNKASLSVLGINADDLLGSHFLTFVFEEDRSKLHKFFDEAKTKSAPKNPQIRLQRADGSIVETVWSMEWSAEEKAFFCVIHDMTERLNSERLREEILAMVSHDLKAPLTAIGNALVAIAEAPAAPESSGYVEIAHRNSRRMSTLISDFLDRDRASTGTLSIHKEQTSLQELFADCRELVSPIISDLKVELKIHDTDLIVEADRESISRVLVNLVTNAAKFSPENTIVQISAEATGPYACIKVIDTGSGMSREDLERVFERFQQGSRRSRADVGSGLGLAICKTFIELHGGKIWAESTEGKGSTFFFTLPLSLSRFSDS